MLGLMWQIIKVDTYVGVVLTGLLWWVWSVAAYRSSIFMCFFVSRLDCLLRSLSKTAPIWPSCYKMVSVASTGLVL